MCNMCFSNCAINLVMFQAYLDDILQNLEEWFGVIGLSSHLNESLALFEAALKMPFTKCLKEPSLQGNLFKSYILNAQSGLQDYDYFSEVYSIKKPPHLRLKNDLIEDPGVRRNMYADLAIYEKLETIFKKQLKAFNVLNKAGFGDQRYSQQKMTVSAKVASLHEPYKDKGQSMDGQKSLKRAKR